MDDAALLGLARSGDAAAVDKLLARHQQRVLRFGLRICRNEESQRRILVLRDVEGMPAEEAARLAGIDVSALKSRLHRARSQLRRRRAAAYG